MQHVDAGLTCQVGKSLEVRRCQNLAATSGACRYISQVKRNDLATTWLFHKYRYMPSSWKQLGA